MVPYIYSLSALPQGRGLDLSGAFAPRRQDQGATPLVENWGWIQWFLAGAAETERTPEPQAVTEEDDRRVEYLRAHDQGD
jgi:hypothetical protein